MKKLILIISMVIVAIAQVFVLSHFFINKYSVILGGEKLKFLVSDFDLTNAKEDGYVEINLKKKITGEGKYGVLKEKDGFVELDSVVIEKPNFGMYVKSSDAKYFKFPFDKYYIKTLDDTYKDLVVTDDTKAYIVVMIKDGESQVVDFMIDGVKVEEYIK